MQLLYFDLAAYKPVWAWYIRIYIQPKRVTQVPASRHTASRRKETMHYHVTYLQFQPKFGFVVVCRTLNFQASQNLLCRILCTTKIFLELYISHRNGSFPSYVLWFGVHNCTGTLGYSVESQVSIVLLSELWKTFCQVYWCEEAAYDVFNWFWLAFFVFINLVLVNMLFLNPVYFSLFRNLFTLMQMCWLLSKFFNG